MTAIADRVYAPSDAAAVRAALAKETQPDADYAAGKEDAYPLSETDESRSLSSEAEDIFFRIWTRREALAKAMGGSAFDSLLPSVFYGGGAAGIEATVDNRKYTVRDLEIPGIPDIFASVCTEGDACSGDWCIFFKKL